MCNNNHAGKCVRLLTVFVLCGGSDDEDMNEEYPLEFDMGFGNIIVVDNLPVVPKEKFEKLEGVVRKIYGQIGVIKEDGFWMPVDPATEKTLGQCFIEYNTPQVLVFFYSGYMAMTGAGWGLVLGAEPGF